MAKPVPTSHVPVTTVFLTSKPTIAPTVAPRPPVTTTLPAVQTTRAITSLIQSPAGSTSARGPSTSTSALVSPPANPSDAVRGGGGDGMSGASIAGMVAGVIVVLVGSVVGGFLLLKKRRKRMMLVGRSSRHYNGYPEPDLNRPPMAPFRREGTRPVSGHSGGGGGGGGGGGSSGYGVLPPAGRRMNVESGVYDDKGYHAAAAGLGGVRMMPGSYAGSGHGLAGESGDSYTQLSSGMFLATGQQGRENSPTRAFGTEGEHDRTNSVELDAQELERERELDLQQQARLLSLANGEPVQVGGFMLDQPHRTAAPLSPTPLPSSPSSSMYPASPRGSNPYPRPTSNASHLQHPGSGVYNYHNNNMNRGLGNASPHLQQANAYYREQQYDPRSSYAFSPPIPVAGYAQHGQGSGGLSAAVMPVHTYPTPFSPQQQQQPQQQSHPHQGSSMPTAPMQHPSLGGADRPGEGSGPQGKEEYVSETPGQKQEIESMNHQDPRTTATMSNVSHLSGSYSSPPTSSATSPAFTATDSVKNKNSAEPQQHGAHVKRVNTVSEVLPSMGTEQASSHEPSGLGGEKEEYRLSLPGNHPVASEPVAAPSEKISNSTAVVPPALPTATKPK